MQQVLVDQSDPFNWPLRRKWRATLIAVFATFTTLINATILTAAHEAIGETFHISDVHFPNSYWLVTSWTIGGAISCLAVLPIFEDFGVRPGFLGTYLVFILFILPQGLAQNFATLVITRFFAGGCVSILSNTAASVIGNVWNDERERTIPMSLYITAYLAGISVGPVIGGAILQGLNWRWISYVQLIWSGLFFPLYFFFFEETRYGIIPPYQTTKDTSKTCDKQNSGQHYLLQRFGRSMKRPLSMLVTEPVIFIFTLWSAFAVGTVYLFTQSVEQVYVHLYGWTSSQAAYVQSAVIVGICIGWNGTIISKKFYEASARNNRETPGTPVPESRLYMSAFGSLVGICGGMFVYGWTSYPNFPWIAPTIGLAMVGTGNVMVVNAVADYVIDAYARYAGSAVAAIVLGENLVAGFLPLATQSMYNELGFQWASTVLGFVSLLLSLAPIVLIRWGSRIRAHSPFIDKQPINKESGVTHKFEEHLSNDYP